MAEEDKKTKQDRESEPVAADTAPKGSVKKWIIIGCALLFFCGGSYAAWNLFLAEKLLSKSSPQRVETGGAAAREIGVTHEMDSFIVNLRGKEGKRYLKTTIELEAQDDEYVKRQLFQRTPQLRDAILMLLASKSFEDISEPDGKLRLKNELIIRINQLLPGPGIRTIYFTEFVVQ